MADSSLGIVGPASELNREYQDALIKGVGGSGSVRYDFQYSDLAAAIADIGSSVKTLRVTTAGFSDGNANNTVPSTLLIEPDGAGSISLSSGKTTTVNSWTRRWAQYPFTGPGTAAYGGENNYFWWDFTNHRLSLGAGTNPSVTGPLARLHISDSTADQYSSLVDFAKANNDSFRSYGLRVAGTYDGNATGAPVNYAIYGQVSNGAAGNCGNLTGVRGAAVLNGPGDVQQMVGLGTACGINYTSATVQVHPINSFSSIALDVDTFEVGGVVNVNFNAGIVAGIRILTPFNNSGGTPTLTGTSLVGLYINDFYGTTVGSWSSGIWGIYAAGGTQFLGGNVSLFTSDPGFTTDRSVFHIADTTSDPSNSYTGGSTLFSSHTNHALTWRYGTSNVPIATYGMQGTPTLTGFGTGKAVTSGSVGAFGEIDVGTSAGTTGSINFANSWFAAPFVIVVNRTSNIPLTYTVSTSAISITSSATFNNNDKLVWIAKGSQ